MELSKEARADLEFQLEDLSGQIEEYYDYGIQDKIVDELGLEPDAIFYIRDRKIEKKK